MTREEIRKATDDQMNLRHVSRETHKHGLLHANAWNGAGLDSDTAAKLIEACGGEQSGFRFAIPMERVDEFTRRMADRNMPHGSINSDGYYFWLLENSDEPDYLERAIIV